MLAPLATIILPTPPAPTSALLAHSLAALELPASRRHALGLFLRHLALGEGVAQRSAQRQALLAPELRAARFLRSQARHEALHGRIFDLAAACVGAPMLALNDCPYAAFDARLAAAARCRDYADTIVGTQLVLEALGEILLERLDAGLSRHGIGLLRLRRLLRAQEASHHAFGVAQLAVLAATTSGGWASLLQRAAPYRLLAGRMLDAGAPVLRAFDLTPEDIGLELDTRLSQDAQA